MCREREREWERAVREREETLTREKTADPNKREYSRP